MLSIILYLALFGFVVDRPLSLGLLRLEIEQKTSRLAALPSPKIVILAGSNGPYSHSCAVIGSMLNLPCENAGIAVGIGLDDLFIRYQPLLYPGDIVYMPMELQQYTASRAQYRSDADGGILLRHDRAILALLPADRIVGALFCCSLNDLLEALAETTVAHSGEINPDHLLATEYDVQGDRIDNSLAAADPALLRHSARRVPESQEIADGYGTELIEQFVAAQAARGVLVVGGMPTDFLTASLHQPTINEVASVYQDHGGAFIDLTNHSLYPVQDFFNSEDHLAQPCQFLHSIAVADRLAELLHRPARQPTAAITALAATCPG